MRQAALRTRTTGEVMGIETPRQRAERVIREHVQVAGLYPPGCGCNASTETPEWPCLSVLLARDVVMLEANLEAIVDALECDAHPVPEHEHLAQIVADLHAGVHRSESARLRDARREGE
jgi:hypothetical protein